MMTPCIAVIDADPASLDLTALLLALDGYQSLCFGTAADATAPIHERHPGLVIIELHLERPTAGLELVAALQQDPVTAQIPILVWAADARVAPIVAQQCLDGVVVHAKPRHPHDRLRVVAQLALVR